ncbi:Cupin domain protein [compost metagenome]
MTSHTPQIPSEVFELVDHLVALRADAAAAPLPFRDRGRTDADWIIGVKHVTDDASVHGSYWERHPRGDETLCLLEGRVVVTLEGEGVATRQIPLDAGQALVVPRGTWHRLHVDRPGRLIFITPSVGSEHRRVTASSDVSSNAAGASR